MTLSTHPCLPAYMEITGFDPDKPSVSKAGFDPDNLPEADKTAMNFGSGGNTGCQSLERHLGLRQSGTWALAILKA